MKKKAPLSKRLYNAARHVMGLGHYYEAAEHGRLMKHLPSRLTQESANVPLIVDGPTIISRVRDLKRNNPLVRGALTTFVNNLWPTPPLFEPLVHFLPIDGTPGNAVNVTNDAIEKAWEKWTRGACDFDGWESHRNSMEEILHLATLAMLVSGEVFIIRRRRRGINSPIPLQIQLYESDRLGIGFQSGSFYSSGQRPGIEYDDAGRPIAYEFYSNLDQPMSKPERIPARDVCHLMMPDRPQMHIGDLALASVLTSVDNLSDFIKNELDVKAMLSRVAAIVSRAEDMGIPQDEAGAPDSPAHRLIDLYPMTVFEMPEGSEFKELNLDRPGANFDMFATVTMKFIAAGLGIPYSMVSMDFREASYSAERMAKMQTEPNFIRIRRNIRNCGLDTIGEWFLEAAYRVPGLIPLPAGIDNSTLFDFDFRMPGTRYIDPEKELRAEAMEIAMGVASPQEIAVRHGQDFYKNMEALKEARDFAASLGSDLIISENGPYLKASDPEESTVFAYHLAEGILTINEVRERLNLDPVPWGNVTPAERARALGIDGTQAQASAFYSNGRSQTNGTTSKN